MVGSERSVQCLIGPSEIIGEKHFGKLNAIHQICQSFYRQSFLLYGARTNTKTPFSMGILNFSLLTKEYAEFGHTFTIFGK